MTKINHQIVKYHNDLNTVIMRKWTSEEMNLFFAIIAKVRNQESSTMVFDTNEIRKITGFSQKRKVRWQETMKSCAKKITQLTYFEDNGKRFEIMTLFSKFAIDYEKNIVEVKVSENFSYILNHLEAQFTMYELEEFTSIRSTYAKTAYRLFKQWRTIGKKEFTVDEFKMLMDMPENYKACHIDRLVIEPIIKELSPYFVGLKVHKKKATTRGNPVVGYEFTWTPEKIVKVDTRKAKRIKKGVPMPAWAREDFVPKEYEGYEKIDKKVLEEKLRALDEKI